MGYGDFCFISITIDKCIGEQMDKLMDTFTGDSEYLT